MERRRDGARDGEAERRDIQHLLDYWDERLRDAGIAGRADFEELRRDLGRITRFLESSQLVGDGIERVHWKEMFDRVKQRGERERMRLRITLPLIGGGVEYSRE